MNYHTEQSSVRSKLNLAGALTIGFFITYMSLQPMTTGGPGGPTPNGFVLHALAYFVFAAALMSYLHDTESGHLKAVLLSALFGFGIELVQSQLSYRFFAWNDVLANLMGASILLLDHRIELVGDLVRLEDRLIDSIRSIVF